MKKYRIVFIAVMLILIAIFWTDFCINPKGIQIHLFDFLVDDYIADSYKPVFYVSNGNPYLSLYYKPQEHIYPPLAYLFSKFIYCLSSGHSNIKVLYLFCNLFIMTSSFFFFSTLYHGTKGNTLYKNLMIFVLLFSGLFLYSYERGNIIILSAACISFFLFNYKSENRIMRELALIVFSFGCVLKISPAIIAILLIYEKRYLDFIKTVLYCIFLFFVPFLCFDGGLANFPILLKNITVHSMSYSGSRDMSFDIFSSYPAIRFYLQKIYAVISIIFCSIAILTNFAQKEEWKRVAQITAVVYSIYSSAVAYTMLYFLPFIVMFLNKENIAKKDWLYLILFIILLNPVQISLFGTVISRDLWKLAELLLLISLTQESVSSAIEVLKNRLLTRKREKEIEC